MLQSKRVTSDTDLRWHVVYTKPNQEKKVAHNLNLRYANAYLPVRKEIRFWSDRKKSILTPLFPGYIFVHLSTKNRFRIFDVPGIIKFVGSNTTPATISDKELNTIRRLETCGYPITEDQAEIGTLVKVTGGPLLGLTGRLLLRKGKKRFIVSIESIQKTLCVEVPGCWIEPVNV
ncbi:MAG: UpxY family transcription antiterminator [Cyclobacteriaceae bacterium]|nr:UpxY family transcription antiterminator [Cyclobacteriaceae bacterium]